MSETKLGDYSNYHHESQANTHKTEGVQEVTGGTPRTTGPGTDEWYQNTLISLKGLPIDAATNTLKGNPSLINIVLDKVRTTLFGPPKQEDTKKEVAKKAVIDEAKPEAISQGGEEKVSEVTPEPDEEITTEAAVLETIESLKSEAENDYNNTGNPLSKDVIDITTKLEAELKKEELNWKEIDLAVRQLAILLMQKMISNEGKIAEQLLEFKRQDIKDVANTYGRFWELALGIFSGTLGVVGGGLGVGGGFGLLGGMAKGTFDGLKGASDALGMVGQGSGKFQEIPKGQAERDRQLHQFTLEQHRAEGNTADQAKSGSQNTKSSQLSQLNQFLEAIHRVFSDLVRGAA